tara:strand:- start:1778 stop:4699 length:2922 start_codon:yes stop_codon:yes gene_type:complete
METISNSYIENLQKSLITGFINKSIASDTELSPQLILNDKKGGTTVLSEILKELENCNQFWFSVAFLTTDGLSTITEHLKTLQNKGISGKILVSEYLHFTHPEALRKLLLFKNIESKIIQHNFKFHQKGYLFESGNKNSIFIGSSNLTSSALQVNSELNIKLKTTTESQLSHDLIKEFQTTFDNAISIDQKYIHEYAKTFIETEKKYFEKIREKKDFKPLSPNKMQEEALNNLSKLRYTNIKKSLLISATGTGKTILSAFDVKQMNAKRCLFVVHRRNIAIKAMKEFQKVFGDTKSFGIYSGDQKDNTSDFIFSTIQTISRDHDLKNFDPNHFDYIIIDETHRAGADSYQNLLDYFKPKFLLGMSATPERTDDFDIFETFDNNVCYEIRLNDAMEHNLVSPFHYFGVTDITVNGHLIEENANFNDLVAEERVSQIIEQINFYGTDNGITRGLIFCSKVEEAKYLSEIFNTKGFNTVSLSGENSESERLEAIRKIESENLSDKLDYIFTVDIFNEGIDIPKINQVVLLRPTQSSIVFIQQLGRGLRLESDKEYLTIIDFIGNYQNSYLVPIALFGDKSYNKDHLRKLMVNGSIQIPGSSTINFDEITKNRIFESINTSNLSLRRDLRIDYNYLKKMLGRMPMMVDFIEYGGRDPKHFIDNMRSYYNFVLSEEKQNYEKLIIPSAEIKLLEIFSQHINNGIRVEESILLQYLIDNNQILIDDFINEIFAKFNFKPSLETINSVLNNLNLNFMTERVKSSSQNMPIGESSGFKVLNLINNLISIDPFFQNSLSNNTFKKFLTDNIEYSIKTFQSKLNKNTMNDGFILYEKYERKDIFRILNWPQNPNAQNVGGYQISKDKSNMAIFVTYDKSDEISETIQYDDKFISKSEFSWVSKNNRTINSPEIKWLQNHSIETRIPLFVKKSDDEGKSFYYLGELTPIKNSFIEESSDIQKVVRVNFQINPNVHDDIFEYISN